MAASPEEIPDAARRGIRPPPVVATVGSHSALDVADGAVDRGIPEPRPRPERGAGRDLRPLLPYRPRTGRGPHPGLRRRGLDAIPKFAELAAPAAQERLRAARRAPRAEPRPELLPLARHGRERVPRPDRREPRAMLRIEERTERENYYTLLESAGIPIPKVDRRPRGDRRALDREAPARDPVGSSGGSSPRRVPAEYARQGRTAGRPRRGRAGRPRRAPGSRSTVLGPVFNFNFFFSPLVPREEGARAPRRRRAARKQPGRPRPPSRGPAARAARGRPYPRVHGGRPRHA